MRFILFIVKNTYYSWGKTPTDTIIYNLYINRMHQSDILINPINFREYFIVSILLIKKSRSQPVTRYLIG